MIDDVALCRRLIKESNEMIERLNRVLSSPNKIRAIPGLKSGAERGLVIMTAGEVQLVDEARGKWQPMRLEATNVQTGHRTRLQFENFRANQNIQADYFTTRYLERER